VWEIHESITTRVKQCVVQRLMVPSLRHVHGTGIDKVENDANHDGGDQEGSCNEQLPIGGQPTTLMVGGQPTTINIGGEPMTSKVGGEPTMSAQWG